MSSTSEANTNALQPADVYRLHFGVNSDAELLAGGLVLLMVCIAVVEAVLDRSRNTNS